MKEELEKLIKKVRDAGALDDNNGGEDWTYSDLVIEKAITSIINLVDKEVIGSADEWDKKYPLSIKQDIKSRNNLRIEQRAKLKGVSNGDI